MRSTALPTRVSTMASADAARRHLLRGLCACSGGVLLGGLASVGTAFAQSSGSNPALRAAQEGLSRAPGMSSSITTSLNGLTTTVQRALETLEKLQKEAGNLATELEKLKKRKEEMLAEYRAGLFCSGCGQTKSQILAKGETFPHSGQKIIRPTAEQIAAKERELQAPIDRTAARIVDTNKAIAENDEKSQRGLEQIRLGLRLWRTATSYWEFARARVDSLKHDELQASIDAAERALERPATGNPEELRDQRQTWQRLLDKAKRELADAMRESGRSTQQMRMRIAEQRRDLQNYVTRGPLFARVGGPLAVPIYPSATDPEMGAAYQMGRIPEFANPPVLSNVAAFIRSYRDFRASGWTPPADTGPAPAPGSAQTPTAPAPTPGKPNKLLDTLP